MARWGISYQGSKNGIAEEVIKYLPSCENLYDLFCGGCAIADCAIAHHKFKNYIINDIMPLMPQLYKSCLDGSIKKENRWISREDFFKLKDKDGYVAVCFSFGSGLTTYAYAKELEPWKKALHYARVFKDYSLLKEFGIDSDGSRNDIKLHKEEYKKEYIEWYIKNGGEKTESLQSLERLESLQSLQSLERLERLESLQSLQSLEIHVGDYQEVPIRENSVLYCDIPYENTRKYRAVGDFDHKRFYDWACEQKELVIVSSYEVSDDRFTRLLYFNKRAIMNVATKDKIKQEGLFVRKDQKELYEKMIKEDGCVLC